MAVREEITAFLAAKGHSGPIDTAGDSYRHACEVMECVERMDHASLAGYLEGVKNKRGEAGLLRLQSDIDFERARRLRPAQVSAPAAPTGARKLFR